MPDNEEEGNNSSAQSLGTQTPREWETQAFNNIDINRSAIIINHCHYVDNLSTLLSPSYIHRKLPLQFNKLPFNKDLKQILIK